MDLFKAVSARYSYRGAFKPRRIPRRDLVRIVKAGLAAPSGCNAQTTTFVIVDKPALADKVRKLHEMKAVQDAPAFIAACVHKNPPPAYGKTSFEVEDCSAAVENILLAISALGYGSVWIDGHLREGGRAEKLNRLLGVPADRTVRILLPVGLPVSRGPRRKKMPFGRRAGLNRHP